MREGWTREKLSNKGEENGTKVRREDEVGYYSFTSFFPTSSLHTSLPHSLPQRKNKKRQLQKKYASMSRSDGERESKGRRVKED